MDRIGRSGRVLARGKGIELERRRERMRTHPCVRLFCIIDTLTITSMLPGVDDNIDDVPLAVARAGHDRNCNMSRPSPIDRHLSRISTGLNGWQQGSEFYVR